MITISPSRQLDLAKALRQPDVEAASAQRRLRAALASFTAQAPIPTSGAVSVRDIAVRPRRPSTGPALTASQRLQLPR
jgi:hypothetical protein